MYVGALSQEVKLSVGLRGALPGGKSDVAVLVAVAGASSQLLHRRPACPGVLAHRRSHSVLVAHEDDGRAAV